MVQLQPRIGNAKPLHVHLNCDRLMSETCVHVRREEHVATRSHAEHQTTGRACELLAFGTASNSHGRHDEITTAAQRPN